MPTPFEDRKSTRLNSSHANISYAVFCLKKKKKTPLWFSFCTSNCSLVITRALLRVASLRVASLRFALLRFALLIFFFFNDTATTEIYTLSLHDALPISRRQLFARARFAAHQHGRVGR